MKDSTKLVDSIETGNTLGTEEVSRILMKIYTKTGDAGQTGLFGGPRVTKDHARIEAFGTVDELNSHLGMARAQPSANLFDELLRVIQCDLFELGAELATPGDHDERIKVCQVQALENAIDKYEDNECEDKELALAELGILVFKTNYYSQKLTSDTENIEAKTDLAVSLINFGLSPEFVAEQMLSMVTPKYARLDMDHDEATMLIKSWI